MTLGSALTFLMLFLGGLAGAQEAPAEPVLTAKDVALLLRLETVENSRAFSKAQRSLGSLKNPEAVSVLIQGLKHDDVRVRLLSITGLVSLKNPKSLEALIAYVEQHPFSEIDRKVREKLMSEHQGTYEVYCLMFAVRTLGELGDKKAAEVITPLLGVKELQGFPAKAYIQIVGVKSVLKWKPKNNYEAQVMSNALAGIRDTGEIPTLMTIVADRENHKSLRGGAITALRTMGAKEATDLLERIANDRAEPRLLRSASFIGLAGIDPDKHIPILEKSLPTEEDWLVRQAVVRRLGRLRLKAATKLLIIMLEDSRENTRFVAANSLASCSGIPYEAVIEGDRAEIRWAPAEKLFPKGKVLVFTGRVAKDVKRAVERRKRFRR